jgi:hypothetical protein
VTETEKETDRQKDKHTEKERDRQKDKQTEKERDRQKDKQTECGNKQIKLCGIRDKKRV